MGRRLVSVDPRHVISLSETPRRAGVGPRVRFPDRILDPSRRDSDVTPESIEPTLFGDAGRAAARRGDPETSHAAAASVTDLNAKQKGVLVVLKVIGDATADVIIREYSLYTRIPSQSESGLRTRRSELVRAGYVADTGRPADLPSGRRAIIWGVVSDATRRRLREPD